jgi:hypothetical protein
VAFGQAAQVHRDEFGQVFGQASHFQLGRDVVDQALIDLESRRIFFTAVMQRHFFVHFGVGIDTLEIDVQHELFVGVVLHVAQQHLAFFAVEFHLQNRSVEGFFLEGVPQSVVIEFDQQRLALATVNDARCTTGDTQTAARTRSLLVALKSDEFHS